MDLKLRKLMVEIQPKHLEWARYNFGNGRVPLQGLLGVGEEIGELSHSELKMLQGIRGSTADHEAAIRDAIGDVSLFAFDYANMIPFDLAAAVADARTHEVVTDAHDALLMIYWHLGGLAYSHRMRLMFSAQDNLGTIIRYLIRLCELKGYDYYEILSQTWESVSQRDWKKFPKDGLTV